MSRPAACEALSDALAAHQSTLEAATVTKTLRHSDQPGLNAAVGSAGKRNIGTRGGWGWEQVGEADILPLEAVTFAFWGATSNVRPTATSALRRLN